MDVHCAFHSSDNQLQRGMKDLSCQSSSIEMLVILKLSLHARWVLNVFAFYILHFLLKHILGKPILYAWYEVRND